MKREGLWLEDHKGPILKHHIDTFCGRLLCYCKVGACSSAWHKALETVLFYGDIWTVLVFYPLCTYVMWWKVFKSLDKMKPRSGKEQQACRFLFICIRTYIRANISRVQQPYWSLDRCIMRAHTAIQQWRLIGSLSFLSHNVLKTRSPVVLRACARLW